MTECEIKDAFELPHKLELISEEKLPSLYSLSSYTNSICSDSTIDLDELDQVTSTIRDSDGCTKIGSKPLQNNFLGEKPANPAFDERASGTPEPSIKAVKQSHPTFSKSVSLHDVSLILPLNLVAKSNTVSCETINSQSLSSTTKSKDSGFQRSLSCLSLTSGKRSYDHVQSKVKAYIKNIKESEALNKKNKLLQKQQRTNEQIVSVNESIDVFEKDDLLKEIQELKHELQEKSLYIDAQQRNYNKLLLKFAEAKNIIDKLRVQSMSLNYSAANNDSQNQISSIGLNNINVDTFDYKLRKNFSNFDSFIVEDSAEKDACVSVESREEILQESFKPHSHSSPFEKSLSPVRKIFSSSSRLDKNYQPLTNPKRSNSKFSHSQIQNNHNKQDFSAKQTTTVKSDCFKLNNHSTLSQRQSMSIDLPNDDPFDKVKKWQASLPSINLLGTYSSSDCEEQEHNLSHNPSHYQSKKSEINSLKCSSEHNGANESEICNILSQELQNKCIITEMELDINPQATTSAKNNQDVTRMSIKEKQVNMPITSYRDDGHEIKTFSINNNSLVSKNKHMLTPKKENKIKKPLNCFMRVNSVEVILPSSEFEGQNTDFLPLYSRESSVSGDSTHLPKSSSVSNNMINKIDDESSDDNSSISSSVLGSDSPLTLIGSLRTAKRRLALCEDKISNKVPKMTKSKSSQTTFVLREPKLTFAPPFENYGSRVNNQISTKSKSTNYETWFKHRNSNYPTSTKAESSQRKAWNARNNADFYVCKDFSFTKSTSLMECIRDMEGLVSKGTVVMRSVVDRNNSSC